SPAASSTAIGSPIAADAPASSTMRPIVPDSSAAYSTTAFSVSISAIGSPTAISSPSATSQVAMAASSAPARTLGMRTIEATSTHLPESGTNPLQAGDDLLGACNGRPLEHLRDARRGLRTGDALHGLVEPVEEAALDLVGEPAAVGGALGAFFDDEHAVRLADARADGVPVQAGAVQEAQVDEFCIHTGLCDRFGAAMHHRQVAQHRHVRARAAHRRLPERDVVIPVFGDLARLGV